MYDHKNSNKLIQMDKEKRIGFLSFIPDAGHVLPLLRLAKYFKLNNCNVVCLLPEECLKYHELYNVEVVSLGKVTSKVLRKNIFSEVSHQSIFTNTFSNNYKLYKDYFHPLRYQVSCNIKEIDKKVYEQNLSLIIADNNVFRRWYMIIALQHKVPLLLNYSEGSLRFSQDSLISAYGFVNFTKIYEKIIALSGKLVSWFYIRFLFKKFEKENKQILELINHQYPNIKPEDVDVLEITSGISVLEKKYIYKKRIVEERIAFPPVPDMRNSKLDMELKEWLDKNKEAGVIFISLGTIVTGNIKIVKVLLESVRKIETKVLWALTKEQRLIVEQEVCPSNLKLVDFVNQPQILKNQSVKCFITHAGAGSIIDGIFAGKPMLCLPFVFDQPYNASVVEKLGIGINLKRRKINRRTIIFELEKLITENNFHNQAQKMMEEIRKEDGGKLLLEYLSKANIISTPGKQTV